MHTLSQHNSRETSPRDQYKQVRNPWVNLGSTIALLIVHLSAKHRDRNVDAILYKGPCRTIRRPSALRRPRASSSRRVGRSLTCPAAGCLGQTSEARIGYAVNQSRCSLRSYATGSERRYENSGGENNWWIPLHSLPCQPTLLSPRHPFVSHTNWSQRPHRSMPRHQSAEAIRSHTMDLEREISD